MSNSNLNGLRQLISLAMRDCDKSVTIPLDNASMIVVEYEKHRVAAMDALDEIEACRSMMERVNGEKQTIIDAADQMASDYENAIDNLALDGFEEEAEESYELLEAYKAARGPL